MIDRATRAAVVPYQKKIDELNATVTKLEKESHQVSSSDFVTGKKPIAARGASLDS